MAATRKGEYHSTHLVLSSIISGMSGGHDDSSGLLSICPNNTSSSPLICLKMILHHCPRMRKIVAFASQPNLNLPSMIHDELSSV